MLKPFERDIKEINRIKSATEGECPILKSVEIDIIPDEYQWGSLDHLQHEYEFEDGKLKIISSMRYTNADIEEYGQEKVKEWIRQDEKRLHKFKDGRLWMNGIKAEAEVLIPIGKKTYVTQKINTGGIWGIASDASDNYINQIKAEELAELEIMLQKLNVIIDFEKETV